MWKGVDLMTKEQVRCHKCNKLLFIVSDDLSGKIETKCTRCSEKITISK